MVAVASEAFDGTSGRGVRCGRPLELFLRAAVLIGRPVDCVDLLLFSQATLFGHLVVSVNGR